MEAATARLRGAPAEPGSQHAFDRLRSDRKLVERFRAGDEAAFARLYERHRARVFAICLGVLGSREDAQDALQEVFASVAAELRREPPRELRPWIARVARNAAIDAARTRRPASSGDDEAIEARASDGTLQAVERRDDIRDLLHGLRDLPEQQRTALVMRELGGDSYADIGAALGVDETAVRGLIARARLSLRARLAAQALACEVVRQRLAIETDGRHRQAPVRRHLRECAGCREFSTALRADARALRGLAPTGGFGLLALLAAWRGPKAVVAGGLLAKGALSSGTAQVAVVCVAALCAAGGAEQIVEKQRDRDSASAKAHSLAAQVTENASSTIRGGAALPVVSGALERERERGRLLGAGSTSPASSNPARRRAKTDTTAGRFGPDGAPADPKPAPRQDTRPRRNADTGAGVEPLRGNGNGNRRDDGDGYGRRGDGGGRDAEPRSDRPRRGGGDGAPPQRPAADRPQRDSSFTAPQRDGARGGERPQGGAPAEGVTQTVVPQVTAPSPPEPIPVPATDGG